MRTNASNEIWLHLTNVGFLDLIITINEEKNDRV